MLFSLRWFMILKLMDTSDLIMTKELQGVDEKDLRGAKKTRDWLRKFVPEWKVIQNLWAKKAWQSTIRHQIIKNRSLRALGAFKNPSNEKSHSTDSRDRFSTSAQKIMMEKALTSIGLGDHRKATEKGNKGKIGKLTRATTIKRKKNIKRDKAKEIEKAKKIEAEKRVLENAHDETLRLKAQKIILGKRKSAIIAAISSHSVQPKPTAQFNLQEKDLEEIKKQSPHDENSLLPELEVGPPRKKT